MKHRILDQSQLRKFDESPDTVHYDGCAAISNMTLCGAVDWVGANWTDTTRRVNCSGCIAVRAHVMGIKYVSPKQRSQQHSSTVGGPDHAE